MVHCARWPDSGQSTPRNRTDKGVVFNGSGRNDESIATVSPSMTYKGVGFQPDRRGGETANMDRVPGPHARCTRMRFRWMWHPCTTSAKQSVSSPFNSMIFNFFVARYKRIKDVLVTVGAVP